MSPTERRREPRTSLSVTVRVRGHDPDGTAWEEMSATDDASYGGASFPLKHPHGVGQVLSLSLPLPRNFRRYDLTETSYKIFALVRNTRAGASGQRVAGVMFIGRVPPKGYETKPGGRYRLPDDPRTGPTPGAERRQHERLQLFVNLRLRRLGVSGVLEEAYGARSAIVIGGGFIGLEMAEQLRRRGMSVALVEMLPQVMPPLDPEMIRGSTPSCHSALTTPEWKNRNEPDPLISSAELP